MDALKDKRVIILLVIIAILAVGVGYGLMTHQNNDTTNVNNTTTNKTVKNATVVKSDSESGKYGYCAICGKALTYSEATNEYTQGKVCSDCASNPYYQSGEGAKYANQKLYEAYPDEYSWMYDDSDDYDYEYDDYYYDDYDYEDEDY